MAEREHAQWEAFRLVKADDVAALQALLDRHPVEDWQNWRNFAGKTLYQLAEWENRRSDGHSECFNFLRGRLERVGQFVPQQTVRANVVERVVDVPQVQEKNIVVEVPETHYHKIIKHEPRVNIREVTKAVNVPVFHVEEEVRAVPVRQEITKEVPRTTIREVVNHRNVPKMVVEEEEIPMHLPPPVVERVIERPRVDVQEKLTYVKGPPQVHRSEEIVEVSHDLYVPRAEVNFIPKTQHRIKAVDVPYTDYTIVEVPETQVVTKDVEVPETTIVRNIKYVPTFEMETHWVPQGQEADGRPRRVDERAEDMWMERRKLHAINDNLRRENEELQKEIRRCQHRAELLTEEVQAERREKRDLEVRLRSDKAVESTMLSPAIVRGLPLERDPLPWAGSMGAAPVVISSSGVLPPNISESTVTPNTSWAQASTGPPGGSPSFPSDFANWSQHLQERMDEASRSISPMLRSGGPLRAAAAAAAPPRAFRMSGNTMPGQVLTEPVAVEPFVPPPTGTFTGPAASAELGSLAAMRPAVSGQPSGEGSAAAAAVPPP